MTTKPKGTKEEGKIAYPAPNTDEWLEIGKIVAPQGLAGQLRVYPQSDFPERFEVPGKRWLWCPDYPQPQEVQLLRGRYLEGKNLYVISLDCCTNRNQAEALRGYKLMVPASHRPQLADNEYHVMDLIGVEVFMQTSGELVGTVVDVIAAGNDLLEVELYQQDKRVLIPFVMDIVPVVDLAAHRLEITPPPGLLELAMKP